MTNSVSCKTDPFAISIGILLCLLSLPLFWAALDLPGVTGQSGSHWEWGAIASFGLMGLCFGSLLLRLGLSGVEKSRAATIILGFGGTAGLCLALWATYERAKEVGMTLPF